MLALIRLFTWCGIGALLAATSHALPNAADIRGTFQRLDGDGNTLVSSHEWETGSFALFRSFDANNDNALKTAEVSDDKLVSNTITRIDENGDHRIDINEYMRLRRAIFRTVDLSDDDTLDFTEFELLSLLSFVGWTDTNRNHRIEASELLASLADLFTQADLDHDTVLTADEASFLPPEDFKAIAKDGAVNFETLLGRYKERNAGP